MKPKLLLRISGVLMFIHAISHTLGHLQWREVTNTAYAEMAKQIEGPKFSFMGASHNMADYFNGYGYIITVFLLLTGSLLWALGDIAEKYPAAGLKLLIPIVIFLIILFFDALIFFMPIAAIFSGIASLLCTWAIVKLYKGHLDAHLGNVK